MDQLFGKPWLRIFPLLRIGLFGKSEMEQILLLENIHGYNSKGIKFFQIQLSRTSTMHISFTFNK
jgi:hypothetical protein